MPARMFAAAAAFVACFGVLLQGYLSVERSLQYGRSLAVGLLLVVIMVGLSIVGIDRSARSPKAG